MRTRLNITLYVQYIACLVGRNTEVRFRTSTSKKLYVLQLTPHFNQ